MDDSKLDISAAQMSTNDGPARVVIHGGGGLGKTTLACHFPNPIIIGAENGIPRDLGFQVPCVRPRSWVQALDVIASLTGDDHQHETAVIDTLDWIEPLLHEFVCVRDSGRETEMNKNGRALISIEDYGYGRGYLAAEEEFLRMINALDVLQYRRRMHVVILMHTLVKTFKNPMGPDFDQYKPKCHERVSSKAIEWAENVLFLHFRRDASKIPEDKERLKDKAKAKAVEHTGERLVGCADSPLFDAKNRVRLPPIIELHDPRELVGQLLGLHLRNGVQPLHARGQYPTITSTPKNHFGDGPTIGNDPQGARNFVAAVAQNPAAQRFAAEAGGGRDVYTSQNDPPRNDMAMPREGYGNHDGVPAHHETRKVDEQSRQDDAFARARGAVEQRDAQRDAHPNAPAGATSRGPATSHNAKQVAATQTNAAQQSDLIRRLTDAVSLGNQLGAKYRADMAVWQERAAGDPHKLEAIITMIKGHHAQWQSQQQQQPSNNQPTR